MYVCNEFNDVSLLTSMNPSNIAILNIRSVDYCCFMNGVSKSEAKNLFSHYKI